MAQAIRTGLFFVFTWLMSLLAAFAIAIALAETFGATEEFIAVQMLIVVASFAAIAVFAVVYVIAGSSLAFARTAGGLVLLSMVLVATPSLLDLARGQSIRADLGGSAAVALELLLPFAALVAIQWALTVRRWRKTEPAAP